MGPGTVTYVEGAFTVPVYCEKGMWMLSRWKAKLGALVTARGPGNMITWSRYEGFWLGVYQTTAGQAMCINPERGVPIARQLGTSWGSAKKMLVAD